MDPLRTPDATLYHYWRIEGIAEKWVFRGTTSTPMGGTIKRIVENRELAAMYPRIEPWKGIGSSGSLRLVLADEGGYLAGLLDPGTASELREDFDIGTLDTIKVADGTNFASSGTVHIHRRCYTYASKSTNDLTGAVEVNNHLSTYEIKHEIGDYIGYAKDDFSASVRVGTTPAFMEGRYISMHAIALDPGGYPITDDAGGYDFEIWRGIITEFPPSPNGLAYALQAETLERMIQEDPPSTGMAGSLLTTLSQAAGNNDNPGQWQALEEPLFVTLDRRYIRFSISCTSADLVLSELPVSVDLLEGGVAKWMTLHDIAEVASAGLLSGAFPGQGAGDVALRFYMQKHPATDVDQAPVFDLQAALAFDNWQYANGNVTIEMVHGPRSFWKQLGFIEAQNETFAVTNTGSEHSLAMRATDLPASIYIIPSTRDLPVILNAGVAPSSGFVEIGDEIVYYASTSATQYVSGKPCTILRDCYRGYAGTLPEEHVYRFGGEDVEPPAVSAVYCIGGGDDVGSDKPDPSIWVSLMKVLTGTSGEYTNGDWSAFPGLGIPNEHIDVDAIDLLVSKAAVSGPMIGRLETLRTFLSDALGLEGYALVTRPLSDGTCRLSPVRVGAVSAGETAVTLDIDASRGVQVHGGLGDIINRVDVVGQRSTAKFHDIDSIAMFGVRQALSFELPVSDPAGTIQYAGAVRRIFAMAAGRNYYLADLSVSPAGRMLAPGDVVALTFANADMTGNWRVLLGDTRLRGDGSVRIRAMRVPGWVNTLLAPTAEIASIATLNVNLTASDSQWFRVGATVWVYNPDEYSDGYEREITAIVDADTITLDDTANLTAGDLVEYNLETDMSTEDRYAWLTDPAEYNWGD